MKKSILSLLVAVATAAAFVTGCGEKPDTSAPAADAKVPYPGANCLVTEKPLDSAEGSELSFFIEHSDGKTYEVAVINDAAELEFSKNQEKYMTKLLKMLEEEAAGTAPAATPAPAP
jgi:hypothetical protein